MNWATPGPQSNGAQRTIMVPDGLQSGQVKRLIRLFTQA
jgi:hypothetical protein